MSLTEEIKQFIKEEIKRQLSENQIIREPISIKKDPEIDFLKRQNKIRIEKENEKMLDDQHIAETYENINNLFNLTNS